MRTRTLLLTVALAACCAVQAKPKGISVQDVKHLALKQCLLQNYRDLTPSDTFSASDHDASFLVESYALGNAGIWDAFLAFVTRETKDFDKLTMPLKDESGKANNVLAQCIGFYESDKLDKYVRETVMK
jgi:hypothetical protein